MEKGLVLLSGGLDSCVATALMKEEGMEIPLGIHFTYGQRHGKELTSAQQVAEYFKMELMTLDMHTLGERIASVSSLLALKGVPKDRTEQEMHEGVPSTYVPGRNTVFLACGQLVAEALNLDYIITGFGGNSVYPDCSPGFLTAWNNLARWATARGKSNHPILARAPLITMSKAEAVYHGNRLQAPLHITWSCYEGGYKACGRCDTCKTRLAAFKENNLTDPVEYEEMA